MQHALGAIRIATDTTTANPTKRYREQIIQTAREKGWDIAEIAEDQASAESDPFARDSLGPWLRDRADRWDVLIVPRLSIITGDLGTFRQFMQYMTQHSKRLVSVQEGIDSADADAARSLDVLLSFSRPDEDTASRNT